VSATILEDRLARRSQRAQLLKTIQIIENFLNKKSGVLSSVHPHTIKDVGPKKLPKSSETVTLNLG
jgi:hypothetical protein